MESCWGEENMKLHTLNMKKAVSKCLQVDAPETELPPLRYLNRFTNNLVSMANNNHGYGQSHNNEDELVKMMKMMMMMKMMQSFGGHDEDHHSSRHVPARAEDMMSMMLKKMMNSESHDRMDTMDMDNMDMFSKMFKQMKADAENYQMPSQWFKEQYFAILDSCYEVAENQPAELDNMYNMPGMQHMGTVKSFMTCCKTAKMRLCM